MPTSTSDTHREEAVNHPLLSPRASTSADPGNVYFDAGASLDAPADPTRASAELHSSPPAGPHDVPLPRPHTRLDSVRLVLGRFGRLVGMRMPGAKYSSVAQDESPPMRRVVGSGLGQDGVFSNMNAKPERRRRQPNAGMEGDRGEDDDLADEDEVPPSYAAAAADAVPPYWETAISNVFPHPLSPGGSGWTPGSETVGAVEDLIIDGMPVGNLFGLLWNLLVSVAFQYVGFLLTFLLHTTHAAKAGSRAGLGITLVQYGASLQSRADQLHAGSDVGGSAPGSGQGSGTEPGETPDVGTAKWLSWVLIGLGSLIFLGSMVSYVRLWRMGAMLVLEARQREADLEAAAAPAELSSADHSADRPGSRSVMDVFRGVMRHNRERAAARQDATGERWAVPAPVFQLDDLDEVGEAPHRSP